MSNHLVVSEYSPTRRQGNVESLHRPYANTTKLILHGGFAVLMLLAGCGQTLFQSNFDPTPVNQPPSSVQKVGTANIFGAAGSVIVVAPPVAPSGKWVQISRAHNAEAPVAGVQGNFSKFSGHGTYTFSTILFLPSASPVNNVATIQFESFGQPVDTLSSFLHIDFLQDNHVRIDDNESTKFGSFPRDQAFIVQVTLNINASLPTAHIVLSGANASGEVDYTILPAFRTMARQFGAIRIWMGFPWSGSFDATQIVVTHQ